MSDLNVLIFHVLSLCFFCVAAQGSKYTGPLTGELEVTTFPKTHTSSTSMYQNENLFVSRQKKGITRSVTYQIFLKVYIAKSFRRQQNSL